MKYFLMVIMAGVVVYLAFWGVNKTIGAEQTAPAPPERVWETRVDDEGPVAVSATPQALSAAEANWTFMLAFDTHSGSLNEDPGRVVSLVDDAGAIYRPAAWDGLEAGGHHRTGTVTFAAVRPLPKYVELRVQNVGGVAERSFRWDLN